MAGSLDFTTYYKEIARRKEEALAKQKEKERLALEKQQLNKLGQGGADPYAWTRRTTPPPGYTSPMKGDSSMFLISQIMKRAQYEQSPEYQKEVAKYLPQSQDKQIQQDKQNTRAESKQDVALAKLEGTGNVPVQLPPNGLPIGQEVTQLFNTVTRCWNPNAMEGDASPWLPGKEEVGKSALNWLRRIWTQAYNKRGSDPRALTGFYYILSILLNNTPPWMDPANLPYYKAQLDAQNIGGIPGLANRIKEMEQTNAEALGRQEAGTTPPTYSTNANNAFTLPN